MSSTEGWTAVGPDATIAADTVTTFGDEDVVVWRTRSGELCATDARCPHQWAHLAAEGVVDGEELVCAAHGWRFATDGTATKLAMNGRRDPKASIEVLDCRVEDGVVFVRRRSTNEDAPRTETPRDGSETP